MSTQTPAAAPTTEQLGDAMLALLRDLNRANDQRLACDPGPHGHVRQALLTLIQTLPLWGPNLAAEAVARALQEGLSLREAMTAVQNDVTPGR
ncbi:hypothetical protein ACIBKY_51465 [Nonomuraea sp. NPDC050394]|uniref:hypothetical protein n=1 Tax=Nonomuraea sp. NPDC050394 TaxID=3364363 RepID=UPI0037A4EA19